MRTFPNPDCKICNGNGWVWSNELDTVVSCKSCREPVAKIKSINWAWRSDDNSSSFKSCREPVVKNKSIDVDFPPDLNKCLVLGYDGEVISAHADLSSAVKESETMLSGDDYAEEGSEYYIYEIKKIVKLKIVRGTTVKDV